MALQRLPRSIVSEIICYLCHDESITVSEILGLRLVNQYFNLEVMHAFYERDMARIHTRNMMDEKYLRIPAGPALERVVRGFMLRRTSTSNVFNVLRQALRDGVLILTVLLAPTDEPAGMMSTSASGFASHKIEPSFRTNSLPPGSTVTAIDDKDGIEFSERSLLLMSKAYINLLGDWGAFRSLDPTQLRSPNDFEILNDKTGHFWAFVAAVQDGGSSIVERAATACTERFSVEEDLLKLKTCLATGLLLAAQQGKENIVKTILALPAARVNLRFQNIRFRMNAMEAAIETSQFNVIEILFAHGWDVTTAPRDYTRALKAATGSMKESLNRDRLLKTLLVGDCQQWRSGSITIGVLVELCRRGDLGTCKMLLTLLKSPHQGRYQWQWVFEGNNDEYMDNDDSAEADDETASNEWDTERSLRNNVLYCAVSNQHDQIIKFLFDNRQDLPAKVSSCFSPKSLVPCFEHATTLGLETTFKALLPYITNEVCPKKLFLLATVRGNTNAMEALLPLVDLTSNNKDDDRFWDFDEHNSNLGDMMILLRDTIVPNSFLFTSDGHWPRCVQFGTFALLCAIKALEVHSARFLLEHGCEVGTRLLLLTWNVRDFHCARLVLPHGPTCSPDGRTSKLGRWVFLAAFWRFSYVDIKGFLEAGTPTPWRRTWCLTTKARGWRKLRVGKARLLEDVGARIITAIHISQHIMLLHSLHEKDRYYEMKTLLWKWKMPGIYRYDLED